MYENVLMDYWCKGQYKSKHLFWDMDTKNLEEVSQMGDLIILDDFLLHTITDEREIKIMFGLLEKRSEQRKSTIVCSQRAPVSWKAMILNDEVSADFIMKRVTSQNITLLRSTFAN